MDRRQLDKYLGPSSVKQTFADDMLSNALVGIAAYGPWKLDTLDMKVTTGSDSLKATEYYTEQFNRRPPMKNENKIAKPKFVDVKRIIHSGPATIVFWEDNTKTVVRCSENDIYDEYSAFCSALAIKLYGTNSHLKKVIERVSKKDEKLQRSAN